MISVSVNIRNTIRTVLVVNEEDFSYDSAISNYVSGANATIATGDSLQTIVQKLQAQIDYLKANTFGI